MSTKEHIFEYLENKAQQAIDSSLTPLKCLEKVNELSGAVDVLIKCHFLLEKQDIDRAFDILDQVLLVANGSL
ncbi:hypothetical protein F895_00001 [Acinetobacter sp. CIP 64.2]|uniref:hypothetical protein n=1 Tax=Acinetobacter sp. CIP 64.2 TaxID=1217694 RepID=UPI0002D0BF4C|nr:hypothetical protein [Acinetobacter sp. CIP 64.2]ENX18563.1 hypothetical protein F895_00001 [Acinetobacter sp. CIP 64.2]